MKTLLILCLVLTGCAGATYRPLIDKPGPNYERDLAECQRYAEGEPGAGGSAVVGAIIGGLIGALIGHNTGYGDAFAGAGAAAGGFEAGGSADRNQASVIKNCLAGRGYSVLR